MDHYATLTRTELRALAAFGCEHNGGCVFGPWRRLQHPQLGEVEAGGFDPHIGIWNPPLDRLAAICEQQSAAFLRVAALV